METIKPYDVLHARMSGKKPLILVATAGGGIQAGAWTAEVLSGLEDLSKNTWKTNYSFADSLTLVSSVSGGATGSMYFLNLYRPDTAVGGARRCGVVSIHAPRAGRDCTHTN